LSLSLLVFILFTRARHTSRSRFVKRSSSSRLARRIRKKKRSTHWREIAKENIKKHTEPGLALRGARFRAEMTQKELADAIGAKPHHISEIEHGKRSIGKELAHRLAKILNMSYRMFL
jgi:DNA-binding XRE family transcriptional regulator